MKKYLILIVILFFIPSCKFVDHDGANKTLKNLGFTNIKTQRGFIGCGEDDSYVTRFTATNQNNQQVSGVVCSGWLKGNTVRFD